LYYYNIWKIRQRTKNFHWWSFYLVVVKGLLLLNTIENIWMKWFGFQRVSWLVFPIMQNPNQRGIVLYDEMHTWKVCYVNVVNFVIVIFDSWMNKSALDTFSLVINFLTLDWESKHVIIGLFEAKNNIEINLVNWLQASFEDCKLTNKIICYVNKWRHKFVYNSKCFKMSNYYLWKIGDIDTIWRCLFWPCLFFNLPICHL